MYLMSLTIKLVVPYGLYSCGCSHIFPKISNKEPTSFKTLGLHVVNSLRIMPSDDHMSFFFGWVDRALVH